MSLSVETQPSYSPTPQAVLTRKVETDPQHMDVQRLRPKIISLQEYKEITGSAPLIPLASVLHNEYVRQRDLEIKKGRYIPGELLPVDLDEPQLRQLFIDQGRKNISHEVKNVRGEIVEEGTPIDWYNPTQPFDDKGDRIMAVRLEPRNSELSLVGFIKENPQTGKYTFDHTRPIIDMAQDPSVTLDNKGNPVLGVVRINANKDGKITNYYTEQFRGPDVRNLRFFQTIPGKDNRPIQLDDRVRAFYRPQGEVGGAGKFALRDYPDWESYKNDVNLNPLTKADLLTTNFQDTNHGGPNFPLPDGQIYGHIAEKEYDTNGNVIKLHYYDIWMLTDLATGQLLWQEDPVTSVLKPLIKVIADRSDFPKSEKTPSKNLKIPQLTDDVSFTGGIEKLPDGTVRKTNGISDFRIGRKIIRDPMLDINLSYLRLVA
ncbi:MAG TPA: DUF1861 family protein [Patescibacteria group bacterium]|nr:DUF1861 family protein [Patescibacteria group bacterium]